MNKPSPIVEAIWSPRAVLGEGPVYDARNGRVLWLDIKGRKLFSCDSEGSDRHTFNLDRRLCSLDVPPRGWQVPASAPRGDHYLGCGDHGFGWITLADGRLSTIAICDPEAHLETNRYNDGKSGPDGRYWAGTMDDAEGHASGTLYAFAPDGTVTALDNGYRVTNGPAFSTDSPVVFHTDSAAQTIYAFDRMAEGSLSNKRVWRQYAEGEGYPDGMSIDAAGHVWVAIWDGWRVEKISPAGELLQKIQLPTARPTSCAFSAAVPGVLFVTSASIGLPDSDALAGSLFRIKV